MKGSQRHSAGRWSGRGGRGLGGRSNPRRWTLLRVLAATGLVAASLFTIVGTSSPLASADAGSTLPGSPYNGHDGKLDTTPQPIIDQVDPSNTTSDNIFGSSPAAKEQQVCPTIGTGKPTPKDDLTNFYIGTAKGTSGTPPNDFLYLAWSRFATSGDANIDFELNQSTSSPTCTSPTVNKVRTPGDLLIQYNFQSSGGTVTIAAYRWVTSGTCDIGSISTFGGCWQAVTLAPGTFEASVSTDQSFGEVVINLQASGIFQPGVCENLGSAFAKSRASSSADADLKDYTSPVSISVDNCAPATTVTTPSSKSITLGSSLTDGVTVTGTTTLGSPAGTVTFYECAGSTTGCDPATGTLLTGTVANPNPATLTAVSGTDTSTATSPSFKPTALGNYCFAGVYTPPATGAVYSPSSDTSSDECFVVTTIPSTSKTTASGNVTLGPTGTITDALTVTGNSVGGDPTGSVSFYVCQASTSPATPGTCAATGTPYLTTTLGAGQAGSNTGVANTTSLPFTPTSPGTWCFSATYVGDANYSPSADNTLAANADSSECVTVAQAPSTSKTTASGNVTLGPTGTITDALTVTGNSVGGDPTGNVSFYVCKASTSPATPGPCAATGTAYLTTTLGAGAAGSNTGVANTTSLPFTPTSPGTWCFSATYAGDTNYTGSADNTLAANLDGSECVTVAQAPSSSKTTASGNVTLGPTGTITDALTVTGNSVGGDPTGNVSFYVCKASTSPATPGPCAATGTAYLTTTLGAGAAGSNTGVANTTSLPFTPTSPGTWCFSATYAGDTNYTGSADNTLAANLDGSECVTVAQAPSSSKTTASGNVTLGPTGTITDALTVTGNSVGGDPTGNVSFYVCKTSTSPATPGTSAATGTAYLTTTLGAGAAGSNTGVANTTSLPFTPTSPGTWCFSATYAGDTNYTGSADNTLAANADSSECVTVAQAPSTSKTTASGNVTLGPTGTITDALTVTGNSVGGDPTGNVSFYVCKTSTSPATPGTSAATGTAYLTTTLGAGAAGSDTGVANTTGSPFTPTSPGTWCFSAVYGGDTNYLGSADNTLAANADSSECVTVAQAPSTSKTTASGNVTLGPTGTITDALTVTGNSVGGDPTGNVSFYVCQASTSPATPGPSAATGTPYLATTLSAGAAGSNSGVANTTSVPFTPTSPGTWCFSATYAGDTNYTGSADNTLAANADSSECVTVAQAPSTSKTTASGNVTLGPTGTLTDALTVTGNSVGGDPTGNVSFYVCQTSTSPATPGPCAATGTPYLTTTLAAGAAGSNTGVADTTGKAFTPTSPGTWCFSATYAGDTNYTGSADNTTAANADTSECVTVAQAPSTSKTTASGNVTLGPTGTITDAMTVTGNSVGGDPTGNVSFYVCQTSTSPATPGTCAATGTAYLTTTLSPGAAGSNTGVANTTSSPFTPTSPGTWCFSAVYGGDTNYLGSADNTLAANADSSECVTVAQAPSTSKTTASGNVTLGPTGTITDALTVTGNSVGGDPTGNVSFYVCQTSTSPATPGPCAATGTPYLTTTLAAGAVGSNTGVANTTSVPFTPTSPGTWCFSATYAGDTNYTGSADNTLAANADGSECVTVAQAPSSSKTTASGNVTLGPTGTITDALTVTGNSVGGDPTGSVSFYVCQASTSPATPGPCAATGTPYLTTTVAAGAAGSNTGVADTTGKAFTPTSPGTWCFSATYAGDTNYTGSADNTTAANADTSECVTVAQAPSTSKTTASGNVTLGPTGTITDAMTVTGNSVGGDPTGSVSFYVCQTSTSPATPGPCAATGTPYLTTTLGTGAAGSDTGVANTTGSPFTPTSPGTWCFSAVYGGDTNYLGSADNTLAANADSSECVTVAQAPSTSKTTASGNVTLGPTGTITDALTVTGNSVGGDPTGNVSFYVCQTSTSPATPGPCAATGTPYLATTLSAGAAGSNSGVANTTSVPFTPTSPGTWCFSATYAGDTNYTGSADNTLAANADSSECVTVAQAPSTSKTTASGNVTLGPTGTLTDALTVTGNSVGGDPTGNVSFYVCQTSTSPATPGPCAATGTPYLTTTLAAGAAGSNTGVADTTGKAFTPTSPGTWCFSATYAGDTNYTGSADNTTAANADTSECVTVAQAPSTSKTTASGNVTLGPTGTITDAMTVTGNSVGGDPTGSVSFYVCQTSMAPATPGPCAATGTPYLSTTLSAGAAGSNSGVADTTSKAFTPTSPGTWCFSATYDGSTNYAGSADNTTATNLDGSECVTVAQAPSTSKTTASGNVTLGPTGTITDALTVTGNSVGGDPTGSVNFYVCQTSTSPATPGPCAATGTAFLTTTLSPGSAGSDTGVANTTALPFTPTSPGTWCFSSVYGGDTNYVGSADNTLAANADSSECVTVAQAPSTSKTTASGNVTLGPTGTITDALTVTGNSVGGDPTGSVNFYVCQTSTSPATPGPCAATGTPYLTTTLAAGAAGSNTGVADTTGKAFTPTSPGTWCFSATYAGDTNYTGSADNTTAANADTSECVTVAQAPSTSKTTASGNVTLGPTGTITDAMTVTGNSVGGDPTGSVSFYVCQTSTSPATPGPCAATGTPYLTTALAAGAAGSNTGVADTTGKAFTPTSPGTWCFSATYDGNTNYAGSADNTTANNLDSSECVTVAQAPSTSKTTASGNVTLGPTGTITDALTVTGNSVGGDPTGNVSFYVCQTSTAPATPGVCAATGTPYLTTTLGAGAAGSDTGVANTTSLPFTPTSPGTWCFSAVYAGDTNYVGSADNTLAANADSSECVTVAKADSTSKTTASGNVTLGPTGTITDALTVTGNSVGGDPTGNVSFYVCQTSTSPSTPGPCAATGTAYLTTVLLPGAAGSDTGVADTTSKAFTPTSPGTWCFSATYAGDTNYNGSADNTVAVNADTSECVTVAPAPSTSRTTASGNVTLGPSGTITDALTVTGNSVGGDPTGSVSFYVCQTSTSPATPGPCAATGAAYLTTSLSPGAAGSDTGVANTTSSPFTPTAAGTWCFSAVYGGDTNYNGSADNTLAANTDTSECVTVAKAPSTSKTTASGNVTLGPSGTITDALTVTGNSAGGDPTGSVSFYVCQTSTSPSTPGPCPATGTAYLTGSLAAGPAGSNTGVADTTGSPFTPTSPGTWCFSATYTGDTNYTDSADNTNANNLDTSECVTVALAPSQTVTTPSHTTVTLSGVPGAVPPSVTDSATVTGNPVGGDPTGTVTFYACYSASAAPACSAATGTLVGGTAAEPRPLTGATGTGADTSTATSPDFSPTQTGFYCFFAAYSGDSNYTASSDVASSDNECFNVIEPALAVVKSSVPASGSVVAVGATVSYSLQLTNTGSAPATNVTVTDAVPAGSTYVAGSATMGGTEAAGTVTWTGLTVPAKSGATNGTLAVSFKVTINSDDTNGQVVENVAVFTNENTPSCTTGTCNTNHVNLTVSVPPIVPASIPVTPSTTTPPAATSPAAAAPAQNLAFTGTDARVSILAGLALLGVGGLLLLQSRRRSGGGRSS